jgi:hypothetical protein
MEQEISQAPGHVLHGSLSDSLVRLDEGNKEGITSVAENL